MNLKEANQMWEDNKHKEHDAPSPETRERLVKLETNYCNMAEKIDELSNKVDEGFKRIEEQIAAALKTKANVWVENVLIAAGATIGVGFLGVIGWMIIQAIQQWHYLP